MNGLAARIASVATPFAVHLRFAGVPIVAMTNVPDVAERLERYYAPWLAPTAGEPAARVRLVHGRVRPEGEFTELKRSDGKQVKEAVQDVDGGRLILKTSTGVVMGLWRDHAFATGNVPGAI